MRWKVPLHAIDAGSAAGHARLKCLTHTATQARQEAAVCHCRYCYCCCRRRRCRREKGKSPVHMQLLGAGRRETDNDSMTMSAEADRLPMSLKMLHYLSLGEDGRKRNISLGRYCSRVGGGDGGRDCIQHLE